MNDHTRRPRLGFRLVVAASALVLGALPAAADDAQCSVKLEPSTLEASTEPVQVTATPSEPIGALVKADIDEHSAVGVKVVDTARTNNASFTLVFDLASAESGTWSLMLHGLHGDCAGEIYVQEAVGR